ncbi:uncharacterized protein ACRADG_010588 [Cochliomyia hominivorax]
MSMRDMKNYNIYYEGSLKIESEPEEGEIVDEYDLIVSSDEELSMRQRIRELEAENEEIEQIAVISRSYNDKLNLPRTHLGSNRASQVPTDVSSISSTEFVTPKKRKRRKSMEHKRKHCQRQHHHNNVYEHNRYDQKVAQVPVKNRHCKRRQKIFAKKHGKLHYDRYSMYKDSNVESVSLDSLESSDSSTDALIDTVNYGKNLLSFKKKDDEAFCYNKYITRDTLRLAVARDSNEAKFSFKKSCLKDKLLRQDLVGQSSYAGLVKESENENHIENNDEEDDDDVQVIENDPDIQIVDGDSTDSMEEKELRLIALKSAVLKKHMARKIRNAEAAYSPTDFDEMLSSGILKEDNKLEDIDVVDLETEYSQNLCVTASPEASPQLMMLDDQDESLQMVDCKPVDMDIANSDSEDWSKDAETEAEPVLPTFSVVSHDFTNHFLYGFYMPDMHELPPPPPGVDDYKYAPPPPPYHKIYNDQIQDMELEKEELIENQVNFENILNYNVPSRIQTGAANSSILIENTTHNDDNEDEEEEALRALLLSKFQSPKNQRKSKREIEVNEYQDTLHKNESVEESINNKQIKPTEFILKEAVKRLKIHSTSECTKEETSEDGKLPANKEKIETNKNNSSLNVLEKLKNRLKSMKTEVLLEDKREINKEEDDHNEDCQANLSEKPENSKTLPFSTDLTNKIDISDITRRLQQIKENVLNSTNKFITKEPGVSSKAVNQPKNNCKIFEERDEQHQTTIENNKILQSNLESEKTFTNGKSVEANFDIATKQTTFKVTITNNKTANKSEDDDTKESKKDISSQENKLNTKKNIKLKVNLNTKNINEENRERLVKIVTNVNETISSVPAITTSSVIKPSISSASTYSLLRATKIVKPNKVINTKYDINRRVVLPPTEILSSLKPHSKHEKQVNEDEDNSRLITSVDQVKHMCKVAPFIISVQNSSNESSEDEYGDDHDSWYKPLYDYNDNASPLSLNLESPSRTPLRSNSPTDSIVNVNIKSGDLNFKVNNTTLNVSKTSLNTEKVINAPKRNISDQSENLNKTPLAVRHLPAAAQSEYRRLVHRMKLLENKRKLASIMNNQKDFNDSIKKNDSNTSAAKEQNNGKDNNDSNAGSSNTSLVKKVLIRNANNKTGGTENQSQTMTSSKANKSNVLRSYENLYVKFGAGIVNNLDKSLKLVEEAKHAKISKLKLEQRIKELKTEMDILQGKHKEEQQKISSIYPSICSTNEVITSLKQKRTKVFKAAITLGKTLKGEDYRLNNDLKESISSKSKRLAMEIKLVNSLKVQDISRIEELIKSGDNVKQMENKNNLSCEEVVIKKLNEEVMEKKPIAKISTVDKEKEGKIICEKSLKSDECGNTEFQNLESYHSNNIKQTETLYELELETKCLKSVETEDNKTSLPSYISPLEHLRKIDSNVDPNGVICPYDLMGNCEDVTCKYVHILTKS